MPERSRVELVHQLLERREAFFGLWTRKEAVLKASGAGLTASLQEIDLVVPPGPGPCRVALAASGAATGVFGVRAVDAGRGLSAAVAHEGVEARVVLYDACFG